MPSEPTVPVSPQPQQEATEPIPTPLRAKNPTAPTPDDEPTLPVAGSPEAPTAPILAAPPATPVPVTPPAPAAPASRTPASAPPSGPSEPSGPASPPSSPASEKWSGRVAVPGAAPPGAKKQPAPVAPTQKMARYEEPEMVAPVAVAPRPTVRRRGRAKVRIRRFFGALLALLLILAVPVVSAYVSYKLASGENPFEWPPSIDLSQVF